MFTRGQGRSIAMSATGTVCGQQDAACGCRRRRVAEGFSLKLRIGMRATVRSGEGKTRQQTRNEKRGGTGRSVHAASCTGAARTEEKRALRPQRSRVPTRRSGRRCTPGAGCPPACHTPARADTRRSRIARTRFGVGNLPSGENTSPSSSGRFSRRDRAATTPAMTG